MQYYCIFQTKKQYRISDTKNVLTVSGCTCNGKCYEHRSVSEGLKAIQEECFGHRLTSFKADQTVFPKIEKDEYVLSEQYNKLCEIIEEELENRKKSNLYKDAKIGTLEKVSSKEHVSAYKIQELNDAISNKDFYKDTVNSKEIYVNNKEINVDDMKTTENAIRTLLNDCICYSDCNGYSVCQCYGHCNHY